MNHDELHERGQALEDLFFKGVDAKLLAKLKSDLQAKEEREALGHALGIGDSAALDALLAQRINAQTMAALAFVPLVMVAWADGVLDSQERAAIEKACAEEKICAGSTQFTLIQQWLQSKPSPDLLQAWKRYMAAMQQHVDATALHQIKNTVIGRAQNVAMAAGGFLGLGRKVSDAEQRVLDDLSRAFA